MEAITVPGTDRLCVEFREQSQQWQPFLDLYVSAPPVVLAALSPVCGIKTYAHIFPAVQRAKDGKSV